MKKDHAWISGQLNFLHILKQKLEKYDFQFLIKDKKERILISEFSVGMSLS